MTQIKVFEDFVHGFIYNMQPNSIQFQSTYSLIKSRICVWNKTGERLRNGVKKTKHKIVLTKYKFNKERNPLFVAEIYNK